MRDVRPLSNALVVGVSRGFLCGFARGRIVWPVLVPSLAPQRILVFLLITVPVPLSGYTSGIYV